jgi:Non-ribosomal peptide synthetase modules and related proteins
MQITKPQKLIYDMEKFVGGSVAVICGSTLLNARYDTEILRQAVNELYKINDALRIRITDADGMVHQAFSEYVERKIDVLPFDNQSSLTAYAEEYARIPLDLYGDLCECKIISLPDQSGVLIKLHHIIGDAWTLSLLGNQLNDLLSGGTPTAYSYAKYIQSESAYLSGKRYEKDKKFFMDQFARCDEATFLSEKTSASYASLRKTFVIDHDKAREITDYAASVGSSPFMLFTAALAAYINRTKMNAERFYIGTAVLNRSSAEEKHTAGMFINTVPVLIELANEMSFGDNLSEIADSLFSVFRHQRFNYGDLLAALRNERHFEDKLYDVMISYQNATVDGACKTAWYHSGMQTESLQIHIDDRDSEGIFRIHYDYLIDRFSEKKIEALHCHLIHLLFDGIENSSRKLYELEVLTDEERQKLLFDFNDTAIDYPKDKCVHQLFEEQVCHTPDKTAVIACDRTMTYAGLNEEADRIAHGLIGQGVKRGDIVAICLPRRSFLISVMLGILKAGAGYLPIDPDYPRERVEFMLADSGAKLVITEDNLVELCNNEPLNSSVKALPTDYCYCVYTSGSTGIPKGTLLTHANVMNYCNINNKSRLAHST